MKQLLLICGLLFVLLVLSSCAQAPITRIDPRVGSEGLYVDFPQFPSGEFYTDDQPQQFEVVIENRGAYTTKNAILYMKVPLPLSIADQHTQEKVFSIDKALSGRLLFERVGSEKGFFSSFYFPTANELTGTDRRDFSVQSFLCYEYKTQTDLTGCVGPSTGLDRCVFEELNRDLNVSNGQGAPIAITDVKQRLSHSANNIKVSFKITVENRQNGFVYSPDVNVEKICSTPQAEQFQFELSHATFGGKPMTCTGRQPKDAQPNRFTLFDEPAELSCSVEETFPMTKPFKTQLFLELKYVYQQMIPSQTISVYRRVS